MTSWKEYVCTTTKERVLAVQWNGNGHIDGVVRADDFGNFTIGEQRFPSSVGRAFLVKMVTDITGNQNPVLKPISPGDWILKDWKQDLILCSDEAFRKDYAEEKKKPKVRDDLVLKYLGNLQSDAYALLRNASDSLSVEVDGLRELIEEEGDENDIDFSIERIEENVRELRTAWNQLYFAIDIQRASGVEKEDLNDQW